MKSFQDSRNLSWFFLFHPLRNGHVIVHDVPALRERGRAAGHRCVGRACLPRAALVEIRHVLRPRRRGREQLHISFILRNTPTLKE